MLLVLSLSGCLRSVSDAAVGSATLDARSHFASSLANSTCEAPVVIEGANLLLALEAGFGE